MLLPFQGDGVGGVLTRGVAYGFAPGYERVGLSARGLDARRGSENKLGGAPPRRTPSF